MARYQRIFPVVDSKENSFAKVQAFLTEKKFKYETMDGQKVFRKGDGFWMASRYIRLSYADNFVRLEAWVDVMGDEMDLEGAVGAAAKKPLRKIVDQVEQILTQPGAGYVPAEDTGAYPVFPEDAQKLPADITKKEYIKHYAGDNFKRNLRNVAIVGYVAAGLNLLVALLSNVYALIDVVIILGVTLGMHLGKSKGCAVALLIYSIYAMVSSVIYTGSLGGSLLLAMGIMAVRTFNRAEKRYKKLTQTPVSKRYSGAYGK